MKNPIFIFKADIDYTPAPKERGGILFYTCVSICNKFSLQFSQQLLIAEA
jgi:hypothetical protein